MPDSDVVIPDLLFAFACQGWWRSDERIDAGEGWRDDVKFVLRR